MAVGGWLPNWKGEVMEGYISSYWEQGWEGYSLQVFQDAAHCDEQTGQWSFDGTYLIEEGDVLSIYSQDGSVLWLSLIHI